MPLPIIVVAGGQRVYVDLLERLPRRTCRLVYCETPGAALDEASAASVVIVDEQLAGGAAELCRRLRGDPVAASTPVVVCGSARPGGRETAPVLARDRPDEIVGAIARHCPEVARPVENGPVANEPIDDEEDVFDVERSTVIWRRPEEITQQAWPPPPPTFRPDGDVLSFTRNFAGYANSLLEAYGQFGTLDDAERHRLAEAARQTLDATEEVMATSQRGINEALMGKDVGQMRELSAARNVMHDKLRELKMRVAEHADEERRPPAAPTSAARQKSEITRAAEAREAQRKPRPSLATGAATRATPIVGTSPAARRSARPGRSRLAKRVRPGVALLVVTAVLLIGAAIVFIASRPRQAAETAQPSGNRPPTMRAVVLERTSAAIIARPDAADPDGDQVSFIIRWQVNGKTLDGAYSGRLLSQHYREGDTVQAEVTPTDQHGRGAPMLSQPLSINR